MSNPFYTKWQPTPELAVIVGIKPITRPKVIQKIWAYVKKHNLQDTQYRRRINCDSVLFAIYGKDVVSMFDLSGLTSKHLKRVKKVPEFTYEVI